MVRAAKLEALGVRDDIIAGHIGLTPAGFATMKQSDEYKRVRLTETTKILSEEDLELAEDTHALREILKQNVPAALQTIADAVAQRMDAKLAFQAAESLLDRDGRFMKVSRSIINTTDELPSFLSQKDDEVVNRIANAQQLVPPVKNKDGKETIQ